MRNMMKSMQKQCPLRRMIALLIAICMLPLSALAELQDDAMDALAGFDVQADDGMQADAGFAAPAAAQVSLNMDADILLGYVGTGVSINPLQCTDRDIVSLNQLVFESVVELDDEMKPSPLLADSWSSDGKTWTFQLRRGVTFHNGVELTAYEVVYSYQAFAAAGELNPYYTRVQMIESMEATDNYTLVVNFKMSGYVALYAMTFPVLQSGTMNDALARGTGPYWYTEYVSGLGVRLEANPLWWKKDPEIHSITAVNYASSGDALQALKTNQINMFCTQSSNAALYRKFSDLTGMDYTTTTYEMLIPNLSDDSVMGDVRMRQAVMYAIDRAALASNAYLGMGIQCEVPVNPSSWLYESQSAIYYYSPERALQLIQNCGWSDVTGDGMMNKIEGVLLKDLSITILTYNESTNTIRENAANMIADYLEAVGINVEVKVRSKERVLNLIREKNYDLALVGVQLSEVPDVSGIFKAGGSLNLNNFKNDEMEQMLDQVGGADESTLKTVYSRMQMIAVERLPVLGMLFRTGSVLSKRSLAGLSGIRSSNMLNGIEFMSK